MYNIVIKRVAACTATGNT